MSKFKENDTVIRVGFTKFDTEDSLQELPLGSAAVIEEAFNDGEFDFGSNYSFTYEDQDFVLSPNHSPILNKSSYGEILENVQAIIKVKGKDSIAIIEETISKLVDVPKYVSDIVSELEKIKDEVAKENTFTSDQLELLISSVEITHLKGTYFKDSVNISQGEPLFLNGNGKIRPPMDKQLPTDTLTIDEVEGKLAGIVLDKEAILTLLRSF